MTETVTTSGKRKEAIARAYARKGKGRVRVNSVPLAEWQPDLARAKIEEAVLLAEEALEGVDVDVQVEGGGIMGQAEAIRTAVARAIVTFTGDDELKERYTAYDRSLLVSDPRRKEPKHPMGPGARSKKQKSYR